MSAMDRKKDRIIVDLDGTLALDHHRVHHLYGEKRDWDSYFAECSADTPNEPVVELVRAMFARGYLIFILTGRSDSVKDKTIAWLRLHSIPYSGVRMREASDRTNDHELKPSWASELGGTDSILFVAEDRARVVAQWRSLGYTVFQVADGNF